MQVKTLDIYIFIEGTLFFSSVDNLSLASCDSAFVVGHWLATGWPLGNLFWIVKRASEFSEWRIQG